MSVALDGPDLEPTHCHPLFELALILENTTLCEHDPYLSIAIVNLQF